MTKLAHCLSIALLTLPGALQAKYGITEKALLPLPNILSHWKLATEHNETDGSCLTRYILEQETMENWSELVNIQFTESGRLNCSDALQALKQEVALNKSVTYKIYEQQEDSLLFEKIFPSGERELVRMIMTREGLHRLAYVKRHAMMTDVDREQWIARLKQTTIER